MKFIDNLSQTSQGGVYSISNTINEHVYIGGTKYLKDRYYQHCKLLINKQHHNVNLQDFVDRYGIDALTFTVIEKCPEILLMAKERNYIKSQLKEKLFNIIHVKRALSAKEITILYLSTNVLKKIKMIALMEEQNQTETIDQALNEFVERWEKKNGPLPKKA